MDKKALKERRDKAEQDFNALQQQKTQKQQEIEEIDQELLRLQGEYRICNELLENKEDKKKVSPKANVIDADAALKDKNG